MNEATTATSCNARQRVIAACDAHQSLLHQEPQQLAALNAANRFDVRAHDRLAIGDDRQRLQQGPGQFRLAGGASQAHEPRVKLRPRQKLIAAGQLLNLERRPLFRVKSLHSVDQPAGFGGVVQFGDRGEAAGGQRLVGAEEHRLQAGGSAEASTAGAPS